MFKPDSAYIDERLPSTEYRILAVSRIWNALKYFYPYFKQIEPSPHQFLLDFIRQMEQADTRAGYVTTLAKMAARLNDSNAEIESGILEEFFGQYKPIFDVKFVQGKTVVNRIVDCHAKSSLELDPGDIILSIDNEDINDRRIRLGQYLSASTPQALEVKIDGYVLNGEHSSNAHLLVEKANGDTIAVKAKRSVMFPDLSENRYAIDFLDDRIGYVDLRRADLEHFLENVLENEQCARALIIDMRKYDVGPGWYFLNHLVKREVIGSKTHVLGRHSPDCSETAWIISDDKLIPSADGNYFDKKIVVLIDETTRNAGEWHCMFLKEGTDAVFIGTSTNGTIGGESLVDLPGGVRMRYSRYVVEYPDGRLVQGIGIQPDIYVEPTIEGIREGKDEILEAAIEYLNNSVEK
jgi:C-terminal processing protease CtpA/Prc